MCNGSKLFPNGGILVKNHTKYETNGLLNDFTNLHIVKKQAKKVVFCSTVKNILYRIRFNEEYTSLST